ncbi:MAG TPA: hypothetical protein VEK08_14075 [Planctomycetota bacterium]|nr:hypothetical protein [Planctomycetota bacterium]
MKPSDVLRWLSPAVLILALAGCEKEREADVTPPAVEPPPPPTLTETVNAPASEELDLTADRPEAKTTEKQKQILLDDMPPSGPLNLNARKCYALIASTKEKIEKISADLDDGGKQITRLIRTSDDLSKDITELAEIWPYDKAFRDLCIIAKRHTLVLNDELARVPRKWTHVRWAFTNALKSVSKLRLSAREVAELEPKPQAIVGKDGKVVYVDAPPPPVDPAIAKREEIVKKTERMREQMRRIEEEKKKETLPTDLDSKSR